MHLKGGSILQSGKYRIIRVLGQGGFGITYLAEHTMLDKLVAIKEFFPKEYCDRNDNTSHLTIGTKNSIEIVEKLKAKFIKEAKNISKLNHRNIITIHDIFQENDTAYYVMEFIDGSSLSQIVKEYGALSESKAIDYIRKIADAVGYMHCLSMNHLDLKPANIMVRASDDEPILIDFGLSKQYDASGGQTSTTPIGISHGFAPIEQYRPGGVSTFTPQTDIYSLGATLFNLLSGSVPPHYSEILEDGLPELPKSVSQRTWDAIEHTMAVNKNKRPKSVAEFIAELRIEQSQKTNKAVSTVEPPQFVKPSIEAQKPEIHQYEAGEETVLIGNKSPKGKETESEPTFSIHNIEFVDLGLSVKWANKNIGAISEGHFGEFISNMESDGINQVYTFNTLGAKIPTIHQWEELRNKCKWTLVEMDGVSGYKVTGKTGKSIFLPFSGSDVKVTNQFFGRLFTREGFCSNKPDSHHYFYFRPGNHFKNISLSLNYNSPVRLVKE